MDIRRREHGRPGQRLPFLPLLVASLGLVACDVETPTGLQSALVAIVSDPVSLPQPTQAATAGGPLLADGFQGDPVYVSLPPGSLASGTEIEVTNLTGGSAALTPLVDGGFDPVAIPGAVGDELRFRTLDGGIHVAEWTEVVPLRSPPFVVRTNPPKGKRDVPVALSISVVFSEPIDPATVTQESIRLLRGGTPVAVDVELSTDGLRAVVTPDDLLTARTEYVLEIKTTVSDLERDTLDPAVSISFSTTDAPASARVASVTISSDTVTAHTRAGPLFWLRAKARDASGNELNDVTLTWTSSDAQLAGAVVPETSDSDLWAYVEGSGLTGSVTITAREPVSGVQGSVTVILENMDGPGLSSFDVGEHFICLLTNSGRIFCQGDNPFGMGGAYTWVEVRSNREFMNLSVGWHGGCALTTGGEAYCWGQNNDGALGTCNRQAVEADECWVIRPVSISSSLTFEHISATRYGYCGLVVSGAAYCWGQQFGGLVSGEVSGSYRAPVAVAGGLSFSTVDAARATTCGLTASGDLYCWGSGYTYDVTAETTSSLPVLVASGLGLIDVSVGYEIAGNFGPGQVCALTSEGAALCWPLGSRAPAPPVPVTLGSGISLRQIDSGMGPHTCGLAGDGSVYCWGWRYDDELNSVPFEPTRVDGLTLQSLSSGAGGFDGYEGQACGVGMDGAGYCWMSAAGTWEGAPVGQPWRVTRRE